MKHLFLIAVAAVLLASCSKNDKPVIPWQQDQILLLQVGDTPIKSPKLVVIYGLIAAWVIAGGISQTQRVFVSK